MERRRRKAAPTCGAIALAAQIRAEHEESIPEIRHDRQQVSDGKGEDCTCSDDDEHERSEGGFACHLGRRLAETHEDPLANRERKHEAEDHQAQVAANPPAPLASRPAPRSTGHSPARPITTATAAMIAPATKSTRKALVSVRSTSLIGSDGHRPGDDIDHDGGHAEVGERQQRREARDEAVLGDELTPHSVMINRLVRMPSSPEKPITATLAMAVHPTPAHPGSFTDPSLGCSLWSVPSPALGEVAGCVGA